MYAMMDSINKTNKQKKPLSIIEKPESIKSKEVEKTKMLVHVLIFNNDAIVNYLKR
jgi:hypothetical protein